MENVELANTSEKFAPMAETMVPVLFRLLRDRVALDEDIWAKDEEICKQNIANGLRGMRLLPKKLFGKNTASVFSGLPKGAFPKSC